MAKQIPLANRFWENVVRTETCWLWAGRLDKQGYGIIPQRKNDGTYTPARAHRISWQLINGDIPSDKILCHKCNIRNCVNPQHLYIGTHTDNINDAIRAGTANPVASLGSRNASAKLTEELVKQMRLDYAQGGVRLKDLSKKYGVSISTAGKIINHKIWRHV